MLELFHGDAPALFLVSLAIGVVVGLTGIGGGALMTPALIFFGVPPSAAVSNDLVAAAVNKSVATGVHWRSGAPHRRISLLLICGSVPMALFGAWIVSSVRAGGFDVEHFLKIVIGVALFIAAGTYTFRAYLELREYAAGGPQNNDREMRVRPLPTVLLGMAGGLLVGLSSVGSGTLIMVILMLLYPALSVRTLVGTDLLQAVPLVLAAAIGHVMTTGVDFGVLIPLIVGGAPGAFLGARLASLVAQGTVRRGLVMVLMLTGFSMLGTPPKVVGFLGAGVLILGPVAWACIRLMTGLPAKPPVEEKARELEAERAQARSGHA